VSALVAQHALPTKAIIGPNELTTQSFAGGVDSTAALAMTYAAWQNRDPNSAQAQQCQSIIKQYSTALADITDEIVGCATAQIVVAALRAAGADLTRNGLVTALQSIKDQTYSILPPVSLSATSHVAESEAFLGYWTGTTATFVGEPVSLPVG
jgi:hypothetical protein